MYKYTEHTSQDGQTTLGFTEKQNPVTAFRQLS